MNVLNKLAQSFFSRRYKQFERYRTEPLIVQQEQFDYLLRMGAGTLFGQRIGFGEIKNLEQFQQRVKVVEYEDFYKYIERTKNGESNLIWPGTVKWFAKSSGTTNAKSKYIPVSKQGLNDSHMRGPKDVVAMVARNHPKTKVLRGKTLTLGGSKKIEKEGENAYSGDLSAILIENTPWYGKGIRVPKPQIALIPDFEEKIAQICKHTINKNVASFAGVPSWNLVMLNKVLEYTGKDNILDVWPNMEMFIHGGVNFAPYKKLYEKIIPSEQMKYIETYNASEGFFAIQDDPQDEAMLLMLDYGIFYEFLPMKQIDDPSKAIPLEGVKTDVNYAMIISTSNGLWRYMIGDTVRFTSINPYKIIITGRTKHYINAFGEEVVADNVERALKRATDITRSEITEYTVAPIYMESNGRGAHEWIIEFLDEPQSINKFRDVIDSTLRELNSDYDAKRYNNTTLNSPKISVVPRGTFMKWMEKRGKIGGQNKVPRLYNDRSFADELLETAKDR